ncbi:MAG: hypothetical protein SGI88_03820 [Candidatus Hydrogenedentes bacterium]|nr:hypothetical protein [Candidatus Hydrogenedentota bacterium]
MIATTLLVVLGAFAAAQQPSVQEQELAKPGQTQEAPARPQTPAPAPPAQPAPQQTQPTPAPEQPPAAPRKQSLIQHTPNPEEAERGKAGKPVAAFWVVVPGN